MAKRDKRIHFLVSREEEAQINQRMAEIGIRNRNAYLRKMALNGYCINLDLRDVKELVSLLRRCSNNLNQYAKRANNIFAITKNNTVIRGNISPKDIMIFLSKLSGLKSINCGSKSETIT